MIDIILTTISVMLIIEGLTLYALRKQTMKLMKKLSRNKKEIAKIGIIEIIIGLLIILIISF